MNYWEKKRLNKGVITFSLSFAILLTSFGSLSLKKNTDKVKIIDKDSTSISTIDNNNYLVAFNDLEVSSKNIDKYSGTLAKNCMKLVELSEVLNTENKAKIKKTIKDFDMEEIFYLCDITDSIDLYDAIKNKEYDNLRFIVNSWLLNHGYEIMSEYASDSIYKFLSNYEGNVLNEFDVYDVKNGNIVLSDCFYNEDISLELISSINNHYVFENSDILKAYVTMIYENSIKNNGNIKYNKSRNDYLKKAYNIIGSFNYKNLEKEYNVNNNSIDVINTYNYVVRKNDTLSDIIYRFNTDENRLISLNRNIDLNNLKVGDIVVVPFYNEINNNIEKYTVISGDSVIKIINKYGVSMTDFENANPQIANFDKIVVGEEINIPITDSQVYTTEVGEILTEEETKNYELGENEVSNIPVESARDNLSTIGDEISKNGYARGIDVSEFQGNIDWNKLIVDRHISFAILRMYSIDRNDKFYLDNKFEQNYKACADLGIPVGVYVFIHLLDDEDKMNAEVDTIINTLDEFRNKYGVDIQLPIYIDYELKAQVNNSKKSGESMIKALNKLEKAGYYVGVYSSKVYKEKLDKEVPEIKNYDSWVARYKSEDSSVVVANGKQLDENIVPTFGKNTYNGKAGMVQNYDNVQTNSVESSGLDIDFMYVDYPNIINKMNLRR